MEAARKANVMFVDDEKRVLTSMKALFRRDYNVHLANSGIEALELLERQEMDVIVSDQRMPGMTGVDVLKACKARAPRAMRILLTGYADKEAIAASINEGEVFRYLTKPCARETLKETLALAVSAAGITPPPANDAPPLPADATVRGAVVELPHAAERQAAVRRATAAAATAAAPQRAAAIELMVLSNDGAFTTSLETALGMSYRLHAVPSVEQALNLLDKHPIGVVITDMAVNADEVQALTTQLKHTVPELVTIVASDHSDAHRLIDLINSGQVFRFLLKPIKPKQTAIWIDSAVSKHLELVNNPNLIARHAVAAPPPSLLELGDKLIRSLADRVRRLRALTGAGHREGGDDA
ncbi:MAG TPA: response regulator [Pseudomonadales bacterium]